MCLKLFQSQVLSPMGQINYSKEKKNIEEPGGRSILGKGASKMMKSVILREKIRFRSYNRRFGKKHRKEPSKGSDHF